MLRWIVGKTKHMWKNVCDQNDVPNMTEIIVTNCKYDDDDVIKYIRKCFVFKRFEC